MVKKPILLVNCLITDDVFSIYDRGILCSQNKFDVFRYMIKTASVLNFERIYINFSLTEKYQSRGEELLALIAECFPTACVRNRRLERYGEWLDFIEQNAILSGAPVMLMCNDDHIYLGSNNNYFSNILEGYQTLLNTSPLVSVVYSHWHESRRYQAPLSVIQAGVDYDVCLADNSHDGIQMISPELMRRWFYDESCHLERDAVVRRSEDLGAAGDVVFKIIPRRELFRHFDGYSSSGIGINVCSPLTIPAGFFDKTMKVCFTNLLCKSEAAALIEQGFTICSPATALVAGLNLSQPIYDFTPETIPLAWLSQIAEVSNFGKYQERFGDICHRELRSDFDFNRQQKYSVNLDRNGEFSINKLENENVLRPCLGFHKTPTRTTNKSIILLQDVRFYKKDQHQRAIDSAAAELAAKGISLHIMLLYTSNVVLQGKMFAVLNNLLGNSHQHVDSVVSLNCSESMRSSDIGYVVENICGASNFCMCHNADPVRGLPIMLDVLENNGRYFPNDYATVSFVAAGVPNVFGAATNLLLAKSRQINNCFQREKRLGPDIIESLLDQMEEEGMGFHSAKILPRVY